MPTQNIHILFDHNNILDKNQDSSGHQPVYLWDIDLQQNKPLYPLHVSGNKMIVETKAKGYICRGNKPAIFIALLNKVSTLKKEFAPIGATSFFKSRPHFGRASHPGDQTGKKR